MRQNRQVALLGVACALVYAVCRLRTVDDCDRWAYFAQAQLFLGRDPGLHSFADAFRHPALTPLGMDFAKGGYVSAFPPGYSLLLAFFGLVGGEYWVNPLLGALSVVLVYLATVRDSSHPIALCLASIWAVCPLVAMNATDVMSDMTATVGVLGSYVWLRSARPREAGFLFGLSMMVRPMNALFLAAVPFIPGRPRAWLDFGVAFGVAALLSASVHWMVWGDLLSPSYHSNAQHFVPKWFAIQAPLYLKQTALHLGPVLALALIEAARARRQSLPELVWLGAFVLVYPLAGPVEVDWTRARFLMPAYPAAFVLAGRCTTALLDSLSEFRVRRAGLVLALLGAAPWGALSVFRSLELGALSLHPDRDRDCDVAAARLPRGSLVGALEFSGSLRLYAGLETFVWMHPDALSFARAEYEKGRPLYLILEPEEIAVNREHPYARRFTTAFFLEPQFELPESKFVVNKVAGAYGPGRMRIVLSDPMVQWALLDGWLSPKEHWGGEYRAAFCEAATIKLALEAAVDHEGELVAALPTDARAQFLEITVQGRSLGRAELGREFKPVPFRIPRGLVTRATSLELRFGGVPKCDSNYRAPVAFVKSVETRALAE